MNVSDKDQAAIFTFGAILGLALLVALIIRPEWFGDMLPFCQVLVVILAVGMYAWLRIIGRVE